MGSILPTGQENKPQVQHCWVVPGKPTVLTRFHLQKHCELISLELQESKIFTAWQLSKTSQKPRNLYAISWLHEQLSCSTDILGCKSPHEHIQATNPVYSPILRLFPLYRQAMINTLKQQWKKRAWLVLCQSSKDTGAWIRLKSFIETCPKSSQAHNLSVPLRLIILYGTEKCISTSWNIKQLN